MSARLAIRTVGLSRTFGSIHALQDVNIQVPAGIVFGLLGPNGAGKTTMIRLLLGLIEPSAGTAEALGFDASRDAARIREQTGALLEHTGLYERLSAEDNLEFYGRIWRIPARARSERIKELLGTMGLWERRHERAGGWSRGMKQKLAIARALMHQPALVFLDEPTAGLDPRAAFELRSQLASLVANEGVTVFLTTHNLAEAEHLCGLIGVIRAGRIVAVGSPDQLREGAGRNRVEIFGREFQPLLAGLRARQDVLDVQAANGRLRLDLVPGATVGPLIAELVAGGAVIEEAVRARASLEEVFLALTAEQ